MEKELITRKDGIVYERKKKNCNLDYRLNLKINKEKVDKLKEIANIKGKKYQPLIREIIDEYIKNVECELKEGI